MKYLTCFGLLLLVIISKIDSPYLLIIVSLSNLFILFCAMAYLIYIKKAKPIKMNYPYGTIIGYLIPGSMLAIGFIHAILWVYKFHRYPIRVGMTDEDMQRSQIAKDIAKFRLKKIKKVLK